MISFNKIVKKMGKLGGKVLFREDIFEIVDPEKQKKNSNYIDKLIYKLKSVGIIISIKSGVYIVPDENDIQLNKIDLVDKYYIKLLKKYISYYVASNYYISANKALEIHLKDYSVTDKIVIINRSLNKKIKVGDYHIVFKTISGKMEGKKINLFTKLNEYSVVKEIGDMNFHVANLELSLLESAVIIDSNQGLDFNLLNKAIKKYHSVLDRQVFYRLGAYKFIMSFNRLKEISKSIDQELYNIFLDIIKKNGGLFIGEGLRGF